MSTNGERRYPPNKQLIWQRLQKRWSREELVRQIAVSMHAHGETDTGLTAGTARRWEAGERWPEPRFRKHLVLLFGLPASDLGLLTPDEQTMCPEVTSGSPQQVVVEEVADGRRAGRFRAPAVPAGAASRGNNPWPRRPPSVKRTLPGTHLASLVTHGRGDLGS